MSRTLSSSSYAATSVVTFLLASVFIVLLSFAVDPFRLYPTIPRVSPGDHIDLLFHLRLHTPYAVKQVQPDILVMGSSRSSVLPPRLLSAGEETAYNASLTGVSLGEVHQMIEHAQAHHPLKRVLIGVDQQMFWQQSFQADFLSQPERYAKVDPTLREKVQHLAQQVEDHWRTLYSLQALIKVWSLLSGESASKKTYRDDGTWDLFDHRPFPAEAYYTRAVKNRYRAEVNENTAPIAYDALRELLTFTRENGIQVILFITPHNGLIMQALNWAGTWQKYLQWQRDLVMLVAKEFPETKIYGVEDRSALVLEPVETSERLFHDGLHYSRRAAEEIVGCLAEPCKSSLSPTRLDSDSIDTYLNTVDGLRRQYAEDSPGQVALAREWLALQERSDSP